MEEHILLEFTEVRQSPFIFKPIKAKLMAHMQVTEEPSLRGLPQSWLGT